MKKFAACMIILLASLVLLGCKEDSTTQKAEPGISIKGEWRIINVNCPDILAEKDGARRIFRYRPPTGIAISLQSERIRLCKKTVKPGWIIQAESEHEYHLFPPLANSVKSGQPSKQKPGK